MEILAFLVGFYCLVLIAWVFGFFNPSTQPQKFRSKSQPHRQTPPKVLELQERDTTIVKPTPPRAPLQNEITPTSTHTIAPRQSPAFRKSRVRLPQNKHQQNIQRGERVLQRLRSEATEVELPMVLAILRQMNPYAFEELLLTCCQEQGWQIQRNFRYSNDGGVDGRITIKGDLYLLQAKRYTGHIKLEHIRDFHSVIEKERAAGGFFIHSGKTGQVSKKLLDELGIKLISGQRLINFVLGREIKFVGITVATSSKQDSN